MTGAVNSDILYNRFGETDTRNYFTREPQDIAEKEEVLFLDLPIVCIILLDVQGCETVRQFFKGLCIASARLPINGCSVFLSRVFHIQSLFF